MRTAAILVAAGSGSRFGAETPKQFLPLLGRPVIRHAAEALAAHVGGLLQPVGEASAIGAALDGLAHLPPVPGGATRQDSVRAGLEALAPHEPDFVLVHDAARPLIPPGTISALLAALRDTPGAIPAVPVADTLKRVESGRIIATVPRDGLFRAQTPQAFRFDALLAAHRAARGSRHRRCGSPGGAGRAVALVPGSEDNIKITYKDDLMRLERAMSAHLIPRVGTGFDVHVLRGRPPPDALRRRGAARARPGRPLGCRRRHPRAVRRDLRRAGRGRYRPALPARARRPGRTPTARASWPTPPAGSPRAAACSPTPTLP